MSIVKAFLLALLLIWCFDGGAAVNCDGEPSSTEGKLLKKLFCYNYDKTERPVKNHLTPVNVSMTMHIQNYDVYEYKSTLNLYVWMSFVWKDEFLRWDRTEYEMDKLIVESSELWRPTIVPFSNIDNADPDTACSNHRCEVNVTGDVLCVPPCNYRALCVGNTAEWPFDILNCSLLLGMWIHEVDGVALSPNSNVSTRYIEVTHAEWKLLSADIRHSEHSPKDSVYPTLKYSFKLERHVAIYGAILTPGFVMVAISMAVLWMNSSNNERLYILCGTCMSHFTYLEYLYWRAPYHGEQVPKMLIFFRDSLIINVLILAFTIILRHTRASAENSDRFVDRLAHKVASTNLGRVLLQADDAGTAKPHRTASGDSNENENNTTAGNVDGDTVNLVVDASENNGQTGGTTNVAVANATLVATFMDRVIFLCCVLCYGFMICNLLPKETE